MKPNDRAACKASRVRVIYKNGDQQREVQEKPSDTNKETYKDRHETIGRERSRGAECNSRSEGIDPLKPNRQRTFEETIRGGTTPLNSGGGPHLRVAAYKLT
jgi:hypothetical protein